MFSYQQIDLLIVGLFLVLMVIIGIYYCRGIASFQDYAVGNRKMSTTVITLSLIATIYGGEILSRAFNNYYRQGLYALLSIRELGDPIRTYLAGKFIIPRMKEFSHHLSIAESMGSLYGQSIRLITAIAGILMSIAVIAIQIKVGINITTELFPERTVKQFLTYAVIVLILLVILYATFGGARAVALTDVYQFLFFGLCLPILICILLYHNHTTYSTISWLKLIEIPQFNIHKLSDYQDGLNFKKLKKDILCLIGCAIFKFNPAGQQRFYMASSLQQATKVFIRASVIRVLFACLFLSVAVALHKGGHTISDNQNVLNYLVRLVYFPGMRGMLVTVIFSLLMSTTDSYLHAASVLFANDIWPLVRRSGQAISKPSLAIVRIASIFIGIMSLLLILHTTDSIVLIQQTVHLYTPMVTIPFVMACCGFRTRPLAALLSIGINTTLAIYQIHQKGNMISLEDTSKLIIYNVCIWFVSHYILPKIPHTGWVGIKDSSAWDLQNQIMRRWWLARFQQLKSLFTKNYWENIFPKQERTFIVLGMYWVIHAAVAIFFIQKNYWMPYIYLYMAVMAGGTMIALYPAWHSYKKGGNVLLHGLWPILLFLLLFLVPMQFAKLSLYSPMVCGLWITSLSLAVVLLSFPVSLILLGITFLLHKIIPPYIPFWDVFFHGFGALSIELLLAMMLISTAIVGFGMYRYLQNKSMAKLAIRDLTRTYEHRISLEAIYNQANWSRLHALDGTKLLQNLADQFKETYHDLYENHPHKLKREVERFVDKLYKLGDTMQWRAQEERSLKLNENAVQPTAIEAVVLKVNQYVLHLGEPLALLLRKQTSVEEIVGDPALLECLLLINLCEIAKSKQAEDHIVALTIQEAILQYESDQEPLTLPALAFCFSTDTAIQETTATYLVSETASSSILPPSQEQFYQIESRQMVEAHGGYVEILTKPESLTCLYVLPVNGQKVIRFKTYDPVDLVVGTTAETAESVVQEKELVSLLIANTNLTQEKVVQTIAFIKKAHGLTKRKSGAPYYTHPMEVAKILLEVTKDPDTILAGLLHDVVEDTPITLHQIHLLYGEEVAAIVDNVTEYNTHGYPWKLEKIEQNGILDVCGDIRVIQVKLADRLHNIRTLYARKPESQKRIARETLTFYIPWGERNKGPKAWLREMQEICARVIK